MRIRTVLGSPRAAVAVLALSVVVAGCSGSAGAPASGTSAATSTAKRSDSSSSARSTIGSSTRSSVGSGTATKTSTAMTSTAPTTTGTGTTTSTAPTTTDAATATATSTATPHDVHVAGTIATDLTTPWGLGFLPDGTALVTERDTATLLSIGPAPHHAVHTVGTVAGVEPRGEGGLLGLAVSTTFATDHRVYVYYTAADDNRIAAVTLTDDARAIADQHDIVTGIPAASIHDGGRLLAAPDGTLFVGTGEAGEGDRAQQLDSLGGKILHITAKGDGVPDNPFPDAPLVYSYGHRNVQGLAFDGQGQLWASEFGASTYDELNRIRPGGNYGWPDAEGPSTNPDYVNPYQYWPTSEASPSGLAIVGETAFMAALRGVRLWMVPLTSSPGQAHPTALLDGTYGRLRTVVTAPDGSLWLTTSNTDGRGDVRDGDDRILRLAVS